MDHPDGDEALIDGVDCGVCGGRVPAGRIQVLARREDLAFLELACPSCKSQTLGILVGTRIDHASDRYGEFVPADHVRFRDASPIDVDDILAVHAALEQGGLGALVDGGDPAGPTP
jgi:hypothetical protein